MKSNYLAAIPTLLLLSGSFACATAMIDDVGSRPGSGSEDVYLYYGYDDAESSPPGRSVFQDFSTHNGTVGGFWADPDANYRGGGSAWARAHVDRTDDQPFLSVDFAREGHGTNIRLLPTNGVPIPVETRSRLVFDLRSEGDVCVGLRLMERDGEIWGFGEKHLEYNRLCATPDGGWTTFEIPLDPRGSWFKFPYDGNHRLGNGHPELDLLVNVILEVGIAGESYLGRGTGRFDVRDFRLRR